MVRLPRVGWAIGVMKDVVDILILSDARDPVE